jgi:TRAP-type C4-dicarboxylate transport system permease small subunit
MPKLASFELVQIESVPLGWLVAFTLAIALFALLRPSMVRDYDNQPLPYNPTARVIFVILYVLMYAALAVALYVSGQTVARFLELLPYVKSLADQVTVGAPVVAFVTLGALWQIPFIKELERAFLITLHSTRHLHNDIQLLSQRLAGGVFDPPAAERTLNLNLLKKYGVFVKDDDPGPVDIITINNWRKVSSLLRLLRVWNEDRTSILNTEDRRLLDKIQTAHDRKTQLAMTIIRMTRQAPNGTETSKLLVDLMQRLSGSVPINRGDLSEVEARAKSILGDGVQGGTLPPVRLTPEEFRACLNEIIGYFEIEYDILVQQLAQLVAKSTVLAGDKASERLEQLKGIGFSGLGRIERISLDVILWLFLVATFGGFLVVYIPNMGQTTNPQALARFSFSMSIAGLIGALVGSVRRHTRAINAPWTRYFAAGLVAAALYVGFTLVHNLINETLQIAGVPGQKPFSLEDTVTWSLLPLMLTVAIAYLARITTWSRLPGLGQFNPIVERIIDGLCVSAVVLIGYYGAIVLHPILGIELPARLQARMAESHILPIPIFAPLQWLAFLIGFFFVRDVRRVAHATIVEDVKAGTSNSVTAAIAGQSPAPA